MKSQLSAFLLFLLLLNQSLSGTDAAVRVPDSISKAFDFITKAWAKVSIPKSEESLKKAETLKERVENVHDIVEIITDEIKKSKSSSSQQFKPFEYKGISNIKEYLSSYGYLVSSGPFNNSVDQETLSAINTFQQYFNIPLKTLIPLMAVPRCGVPDLNLDYNFIDNVSYPKAGHRWFPKGNNLTYGFRRQIPLNMTKVFRDSFTRWAKATGVLNLSETTYDDADIKVGFYNFTNMGIDDEVYGDSRIVLLSPSLKAGAILLDGNMAWALPTENKSLSWKDGILDLESAAMHQIGHLLGLDHSHEQDSVMFPYVLPRERKVNLSKSDKDNIQQQYVDDDTSSKISSDARRLGMFFVTTLSIAFAYLLLLY